jgi:hypothetical protein
MQCVRNNPLEYIWEMMLEFLISLLIAAFLQCSPACQLNYVHKVRRPPRTAFRLTVIKVVPPSRYCISKPDSGSTAGCAQLTRVRTRAAHNPDILKNLDQIVSQRPRLPNSPAYQGCCPAENELVARSVQPPNRDTLEPPHLEPVRQQARPHTEMERCLPR